MVLINSLKQSRTYIHMLLEILLIMIICCYDFVNADSDALVLCYLITFTLFCLCFRFPIHAKIQSSFGIRL
jgi:hypothetical protein